MPIIGSLFQEFTETAGQDPFTHQNKKLLKVQMGFGPVNAKAGSMVAYQGDVRFTNLGSGGLNKMVKSKLTGEGVSMMHCEGSGELFLADMASEIQLFYLDNDTVSVNGASVLAFSASIEWDIKRVSAGKGSMMAGGLYNVELSGTGYVAVTTKGEPVALDVGGRAHLRRRQRRRAVDLRCVHGHPCGHRGPEVHDARWHRRAGPDGLRRPGVRAGAARRRAWSRAATSPPGGRRAAGSWATSWAADAATRTMQLPVRTGYDPQDHR